MSNEEVYRRAFEAAMRYLPNDMRQEIEEGLSYPSDDYARGYVQHHAAMRAAWLLMQEGGDE